MCNELTSLTVDPGQEWFEEVSRRVDACAADVQDYIDSRRCDPASTSASMTNSWIEKHAPNMAIPYEQNGVEDVIANMTGLSLGDTIEQASVSRRPYYVRIHDAHLNDMLPRDTPVPPSRLFPGSTGLTTDVTYPTRSQVDDVQDPGLYGISAVPTLVPSADCSTTHHGLNKLDMQTHPTSTLDTLHMCTQSVGPLQTRNWANSDGNHRHELRPKDNS